MESHGVGKAVHILLDAFELLRQACRLGCGDLLGMRGGKERVLCFSYYLLPRNFKLELTVGTRAKMMATVASSRRKSSQQRLVSREMV